MYADQWLYASRTQILYPSFQNKYILPFSSLICGNDKLRARTLLPVWASCLVAGGRILIGGLQPTTIVAKVHLGAVRACRSNAPFSLPFLFFCSLGT